MGLNPGDVLQLLSGGTLSMAEVHGPSVAGELPAMGIQELWGIYPDRETAYLSQTGMYRQLEEMVARETGGGFIVNHNWNSDSGQFIFSKKPLRTLEDFDGLMIRSHSPALSSWINGTGAWYQLMQFAEVYTALRRGILDAAITGSIAGYIGRWWEFTGYLHTGR